MIKKRCRICGIVFVGKVCPNCLLKEQVKMEKPKDFITFDEAFSFFPPFLKYKYNIYKLLNGKTFLSCGCPCSCKDKIKLSERDIKLIKKAREK